jgi:hypothetical protein
MLGGVEEVGRYSKEAGVAVVGFVTDVADGAVEDAGFAEVVKES